MNHGYYSLGKIGYMRSLESQHFGLTSSEGRAPDLLQSAAGSEQAIDYEQMVLLMLGFQEHWEPHVLLRVLLLVRYHVPLLDHLHVRALQHQRVTKGYLADRHIQLVQKMLRAEPDHPHHGSAYQIYHVASMLQAF